MEQFDLDARYQSVLRATAGGSLRGYNCPVCSEHFKAGPRLWEHAKKAHGDTLGLTEDANEAGVKKEFLGRAYVSNHAVLRAHRCRPGGSCWEA